MRKLCKKVFVTSLLTVGLLGCSDSGPNVKEGLWEITFSAEMGGMKMPATTVSQCLTDDALVPQQADNQSDCKEAEVTINGDTVVWKMDCTSSKGEGAITYKGDKMDGGMTVSSNVGGMAFNMESKISGKRVGNCPE